MADKTVNASINKSRKFGGNTAPYGDASSYRRGPFAEHPASIPKYGYDKDTSKMSRLYLPSAKALLKVKKEDQDILSPLVNAGYFDFLHDSVTEGFTERTQIRRLINGAFAAYYFGMEPPVFQFSGTVFNDRQADWRINFLRLYTRYLRGTKLAKLHRRVWISYDNVIIKGEIQSMNTNIRAAQQTFCPFAFSVLVSEMIIKSSAGLTSPNIPDINLTSFTSQDTSAKKEVVSGIRSPNKPDAISKRELVESKRKKRLVTVNTQINQTEAKIKVEIAAADEAEESLVDFVASQGSLAAAKTSLEYSKYTADLATKEKALQTSQVKLTQYNKEKAKLVEKSARTNKNIKKRTAVAKTSTRVTSIVANTAKATKTTTNPVVKSVARIPT